MSDAAALAKAIRGSRQLRARRTSRGFKGHPLAQLTLVRFREFVREPEAVFWTFVFPILLAAGLGIAFRQRGADVVQIGVVSRPGADTSVVAAMKKDSTLVTKTMDDSAGAVALRTGKIALLVIPGSGRDSVRYVYDRGRSDAVNARLVVDRAIQSGAGRVDVVTATDTYVTETGSRYIDFLVPGLLGMNLMGSSIWSLAFAIVTARHKKLLKRLMATPMSRLQYLLSFLFSRLLFLIIEVVTLVGFGYFAFGVPLRGSLAALMLIALLGAVSFGGLGLLCASRARTVEAVSGIANFVMLPMWVFSGVLFVVEFSGGRSAVHPAVAADGGERCVARQHAGGHAARGAVARAPDHFHLGIPQLFRGPQAFPLALTE